MANNAKNTNVSPEQIADEQLEGASGGATGRRTYEPIVIRERIDYASPLILAGAAQPDDFTQGS